MTQHWEGGGGEEAQDTFLHQDTFFYQSTLKAMAFSVDW